MASCIRCKTKTTRVYQERVGKYELCRLCWDIGYRLYFSDGLGNPTPYIEGKRNVVALGNRENGKYTWLAWATDLVGKEGK